MNPWLVIDPGYSLLYDGMEPEVEWDEPDEEEYEEPEFNRTQPALRKKRILLPRR